MAEQLKNWAVDAVDPPKKGTSYTILPNRHGYLNRKVKLPHIDDASPPVTPLNVSSKPRTKGTVPNVSPVKESKKADTVRRTTPSAKVKGIELLRSTPPVSLELPPNSSMYLPPINPSERYRKHRDDQHQKPGKSGPDPTPGTSRQGSHVQGLPSSKVKDLSSSHLRLQNKIIKKRRQLRKLTSMRSRLNVEEEMTRLELDELEKSYHRSPTGRSERQSGGANITLSRIESKIQNGISTDLDALLKALRENNLTFLNEDQKSLDSPNPSESCPLVTETEKGSDADTAETYLDNTSSKACESAMTHIFDIPIPCQLRNPLASTAELKYFMPCDHYPTNFAVSQPSVGSPKICHLVSSAQRALYTRFVSNPLDVERLVRSKNESTEVSLNAPRAQFSTIACEDKELLRLTVTKPHVTRMETDKELDVSRAPVRCPDYNCQRMSFVSDFNTHMWHNHRSLAMECIRPGHTNTFLLDTNITLLDKPKCHMVYMVRDKIIDSQAEDLKDLLPVLLMSARTHWANSFGYSEHWDAREVSEENPIPDKEFLVLWLTGVVPRDMKLLATISVWSTLGPQMADCVDVNTGYIYDIREPSEVGRIVRSRSSMILPMSMISQMTDNGSRFLPVQVKIH
ncbi:GD14955 [Drosophila simulans]|uniref:GD14955 n=1 Tax=Drosophila simulans TaxID=7240 RepID=B4QJS1_DROSI|nr:GD14955 [Drosophila simulans]